MTPGTRLAALALGVSVGFSGGAIVGTAAGPLQASGDVPAESATPPSDHEPHHPDPSHAEHRAGSTSLPGGVLISQSGYSLEPETTALTGVPQETFGFRIVGPAGATVQAFEPRHERELHLVVVNRDLLTYLHLHPTRGADGRWSVQLPGMPPGLYRGFASFAVADGPELTLGVDLLVPGVVLPFAPLPAPTPIAPVDGYVVTLRGMPVAGVDTEVGFTVERDGAVVTDLAPHLGAWGHLVALRAGDLAYNHVHPVGVESGGTGPAESPPTEVPFRLEAPSPGDYRLFFDFAHGGGVHTAAFTVHVPADGERPLKPPTTTVEAG
ncbi:MAG: hypothetical protein ACRD2C_18035 [Acidimicrobiales bacterium]